MDEEDISTALFDLLDETSDILSLFLQDSVHSRVVLDNDTVFDISLGSRQVELDQSDLGVLDLSGATSRVGSLVVGENETINDFSVIDSTTELLDDLDISQIDVVSSLGIDDLYMVIRKVIT